MVQDDLTEALNDPRRLAALYATDLLDSPPEEAFDRLTRLTSAILQVPVAMVTLVDNDRQYYKSHRGLPPELSHVRETSLEPSFCKYVVASSAPVVVPDTRLHPIFSTNDVAKKMNVIAYLGVPLKTPDGEVLGTLCSIDAKVHEWTKGEIMALQDLALLVMTEIETRIIAKQFQRNYLELRNLELQREEMTQMLVHDLRNPLNSLLFGLEAVQVLPGLSPVQKKFIGHARQGGHSLLRMINDILDVNKSETGVLALELTSITPPEVIEVACEQMSALAQQAGVKLTTDFAPNLPTVQADREKLRRVLVNLISNAIQHTPTGGGVHVTVRADLDRRGVIYEVRDNGSGISEETFAHIFEKYCPLSPRPLVKVSTGLGLPFCKLAVEAHGGQITVESHLGRGTLFRFTIPCAPVPVPAAS